LPVLLLPATVRAELSVGTPIAIGTNLKPLTARLAHSVAVITAYSGRELDPKSGIQGSRTHEQLQVSPFVPQQSRCRRMINKLFVCDLLERVPGRLNDIMGLKSRQDLGI